ncbi:MAG: hypothetical protein LBV60_14265 [Streptomyces sp.]|nr:hypothetical protein [Streptomyces sp.]
MRTNSADPPPFEPLPDDVRSLAGILPNAPIGTLFLRSRAGGLTAPARPGAQLGFGRNEGSVQLCIGADDPCISRCHGRLTCHGTDWWLYNNGNLPIRLSGATYLLSGKEVRLKRGYSALFLQGDGEREHLLEVAIVGPAPLKRPVTPRGEHRVKAVRDHLSTKGVVGLTRREVGEPVGNALNHNLIQEPLRTTTLTPPDLRRLGIEDDQPAGIEGKGETSWARRERCR